MPATIFHRENGNTEDWLYVNDDGTVTYEAENAGWVQTRKGLHFRSATLSAAEAKARWPDHAMAIDAALMRIGLG